MKEASRMSYQVNLWDSPNAISSQALEYGHTLSGKPDGLTIGPFGQEAAHANLSARLAKEQGLLMSGIYGRHSSGSSDSAALSFALANRCRAKMAELGSTMWRLTWKVSVSRWGRQIPRVVATARHIRGTVYTGWQSPTAQNARHGSFSPSEQERDPNVLHNQAQLAAWPTPRDQDSYQKVP